MKRIWNCLVVAALIVAAVWLWTNLQRPAADAGPFARLFEPGALRGFVLASTDARAGSTMFTLTNRDSVARIELLEHIAVADAGTLMQDGIMGLHALYANALSPYPTDLSSQVATDPAFRPRLVRPTNAPPTRAYFLLYANDRLGYGATTKDAVKFKSLAGWLHDARSERFFKVKLFVPVATADQDLEAIFNTLRCEQAAPPARRADSRFDRGLPATMRQRRRRGRLLKTRPTE